MSMIIKIFIHPGGRDGMALSRVTGPPGTCSVRQGEGFLVLSFP